MKCNENQFDYVFKRPINILVYKSHVGETENNGGDNYNTEYKLSLIWQY